MVTSKSNYEYFQDYILLRASNGSCHDCKARMICSKMCEDRQIDSSKQHPPCFEAWLKWAKQRVKV